MLTKINDKTPYDYSIQLEVWNYQYDERTQTFFKYIGMGMMVLKPDWTLSFIFRGKNRQLLIHASKQITDSIEYLPWAEASIFSPYLQLDNPLMLNHYA